MQTKKCYNLFSMRLYTKITTRIGLLIKHKFDSLKTDTLHVTNEMILDEESTMKLNLNEVKLRNQEEK